MRFNFKKISAIAASMLMTGMSVGVAAAANYPAPFIQGGNANVAIVYGTGPGVSALDVVQAGNIQTDLQSRMSSGSSGTSTTTSGEVVSLFSGGTKIYLNDPLNTVKTVLTKSDLPTVLADETFSGNVDAKITQQINLGSYPLVQYGRMPTNDDDPEFGLRLSTSTNNLIYNASATFSKAVNFTDSESQGETITLFGQKFTVASSTDSDKIVLLKSAEKINLDSDNPSQEVVIGGETYTIELVSASDTSATIKVTDSTGKSESKEISEANSRKVNGVTIAVTTADETNLKLSASVVAGSSKVTFTDGSEVAMGEDDTIVDGTKVFISGGTGATTKISIAVAAEDSDKDAIKAGESFIDPVFGTFKLDFAGISVPQNSAAREVIEILPNGDDGMDVKLTDYNGNSKTITWAKNLTSGIELQYDDNYHNISVIEMEALKYQDYVVVGNEDEGYLLKLSSVKNQTTGYSNDYVKLTDVFTGEVYETTWTSEGSGTITIGGKPYNVYLYGNSDSETTAYTVRLNYPDSSSTELVVYPTIETDKGAKVFFYEPLNISLTGWNGTHGVGGDIAKLKFPDGDGYTDVSLAFSGVTNGPVNWALTGGATGTLITNGTMGVVATIGELQYNITSFGVANRSMLYLQDTSGAKITQPALVIFEGKDDNSDYNAIIVKLENSGDIGVGSVEGTWNSGTLWSATLPSDSKITKYADLWGTVITADSSDSDQKTAKISYPEEQVYAELYMGEAGSSVVAGESGGTTSTPLGQVLVTDSEVSSVSSKNLIIVGGSCINSAAATVLGGAYCGSAFTQKTGVGSGQFLIQGFSGAYASGKLALVVAGYEAADTANAATYLRTKAVDTSKKYIGTSATSAEMVTTEA